MRHLHGFYCVHSRKNHCQLPDSLYRLQVPYYGLLLPTPRCVRITDDQLRGQHDQLHKISIAMLLTQKKFLSHSQANHKTIYALAPPLHVLLRKAVRLWTVRSFSNRPRSLTVPEFEFFCIQIDVETIFFLDS